MYIYPKSGFNTGAMGLCVIWLHLVDVGNWGMELPIYMG